MERLLAACVALAFLVAGCAQPASVPESDSGDSLETFGPGSDGQDGAPPGRGVVEGDGSSGGSDADGSASQSGMPPPPPPPGSGSSTQSSSSGTGMTSGTGSIGGTGSTGGGQTFTVGRAIHEAAWLCQTAVAVNDLTPAGTDGQECKVTLTFSSTTVTVVSTGIPNHDFESGSGCCAETQSSTKTFPLSPQLATTATYPAERGSIATAVNGVAIFGPEDSNDEDVVIATYSDPSVQPRLYLCDAHSEPNSGTYHYHADANCIHWHGAMSSYSWDDLDPTQHSKIVGFAPDGFPIYGSFGYGDDGTTVREITSSYRLKAGADGSNGIADQEYVAGLGDLDECNGRIGPTPEFPDGIYHYYSTKHNGEGGWGFPYFPLCYKGVVTSSGGMTGGGGGMMSGSSSSTSGMPPPPPGGGGGGGGMPPPPPGG